MLSSTPTDSLRDSVFWTLVIEEYPIVSTSEFNNTSEFNRKSFAELPKTMIRKSKFHQKLISLHAY
jgi:hypothetical protein